MRLNGAIRDDERQDTKVDEGLRACALTMMSMNLPRVFVEK